MSDGYIWGPEEVHVWSEADLERAARLFDALEARRAAPAPASSLERPRGPRPMGPPPAEVLELDD